MSRGLLEWKDLPMNSRPCAAPGLTSYRYRGRYGWIMIGAKDNNDALREACRSTHDNKAEWQHLEVWDMLAGHYVPVQLPCPRFPP